MLPTDQRRQKIRELLELHEVRNQAELLELLARAGIQTTQPQLSRDLRALAVAKRAGVYRLSETVTPLRKLASLLRGARPAGRNLLVIRCEPGAASAVARALEAEEPDGLVGTVAGDDTVFVAIENEKNGRRIQDLVLSLIG